ncbi:MAG: MBL fold metallo-hydrolase [Myxococcales bacterium]
MMKLEVFRSDKGDCLLITTSDQKRLLVDGGMKTSFSAYVAPALSKLKPAKLDAVYVSHIDADHIAGILEIVRQHAGLARPRLPDQVRQRQAQSAQEPPAAQGRPTLAQRVP